MSNTRFTAEQAFNASDNGEPIMLALPAVARMLVTHSMRSDDADYFVADLGARQEYDAAEVLGWLGY